MKYIYLMYYITILILVTNGKYNEIYLYWYVNLWRSVHIIRNTIID